MHAPHPLFLWVLLLVFAVAGCPASDNPAGESAGDDVATYDAGVLTHPAKPDTPLATECLLDKDCGEASTCLTLAWCDDGQCKRKFAPAGTACVEGCTVDGQCTQDGVCEGTAPKDCPEVDGNVCTVPTCDPQTGACEELSVPDGDEPYASTDCYEGAVCVGGQVDATDANPSALALECESMSAAADPLGCVASYVCVGGAQKCKPVVKQEGTQCWTDDDSCAGYSCEQGECVADADWDESCGEDDFPVNCDDECRKCTQLTCHWIDEPGVDKVTKKVRYCKPSVAIGQACGANPCLTEQGCGLGSQGEGPLGKETLGKCTGGVEKTVAECAAEVGKGVLSCVLAGVVCDPAQGGCVLDQKKADEWCYPPGDQCFDESDTYCTHLDPGKSWDAVTGCHTTWLDIDCNDNNPCTLDSCKTVGGVPECVNVNVSGAACDDANPCTVGGQCVDGECAGQSPKCVDSDDNPCTSIKCNGLTGQCLTQETQGLTCDDGNSCTLNDVCSFNVCKGTANKCNDNNGCTDDSCDSTQGCVNAFNTAECDDGDASTEGDTCKNGKCAPGSTVVCNDDNPCTNDVPDPIKGCKFVPNSAGCDDNDKCTNKDTCAGGKCVSGPKDACNDGEFCTQNDCNAVTGCVNTPLVDGAPCLGGISSFCLNGKCECKPKCGGTFCSNDGCGGLCACAPGTSCVNGVCKGQGCGTCAPDEFCVGIQCVKPDYNGTWKLSANPNTKPCGIFGNTTFVDQFLVLTVTGETATGVIESGSFTVNYKGTLKGKKLNMTANYQQVESFTFLGQTVEIVINHKEILDVTFTSPTEFSGVDEDQVSSDLGPCTLYWNVTGQKQ